MKKESIGRLLKVMLFLAIIFWLFLFFTYLMRNTELNMRQNILDYYEEDTELDVVFIGASNIHRYWDPMKAWEVDGIATRNYAVSAMHAATHLSAIRDALRTQNPDVIVMDVRRFCEVKDRPGTSDSARYLLDSLDFNIARLQEVHHFCAKMNLGWKESLPYYIDLIQYHDNYEAFITELNWQLSDNRLGNPERRKSFKGYELIAVHELLEEPAGNFSTEVAEDIGKGMELFREILEYCRKNQIQLQLVATPFVTSEEDEKRINTLAKTAEEYGIPFLNMNLLYKEIGLKFSKDFYNADHVNVLGADKVTSYLSDYLVENYHLTDHRNEEDYDSWHKLYEEYKIDHQKKQDKVKEKIEEGD